MNFLGNLNPLNLFTSARSIHPGPLQANSLNDSQKAELIALNELYPEIDSGTLLGYLKIRSWKRTEAAAQISSTLSWSKSMNPQICDVAHFMRGPPDGCIVCLEDGVGDCARDTSGRPIIHIIGMLHGSLLEMQMQMCYALRRAEKYRQNTDMVQSYCMVIEILPRSGAVPTFRFPDTNTKLLMNMQKQHFPGTLSSTTHFCGIPSAISWAFSLCKPFMEQEAYNNMILRPDFTHLLRDGYIDSQNSLIEWGGERSFSIEEYIIWRAVEEGVEASLQEPRRYDPTISNSLSDLESMELALKSSSIVDNKSSALKVGQLSKQGSGQGWASNFKWKEKLVALLPGVLLYFDNLDENDASNKPSAVIVLGQGAYIDESVEGRDNTPFSFQLVTPSRNYRFAARDDTEMYQWIEAISDAVSRVIMQQNIQAQEHTDN